MKPKRIQKMINRDTFYAPGPDVLQGPERFVPFREAAVDSRAVMPGDLFIALKGERTDGHYYLEEAVARGAAGLLIAASFYNSHPEKVKSAAGKSGIVIGVVPDTLQALQKMAGFFVRKYASNVMTIGVTGSNGKTTTKELIGAVVSKKGPAFVSKGNLNSEIGLCQEVLRLEGGMQYGVFEMGMNRKGEMDLLADIIRPSIGVITNIGTAHIGLIGSREEIAAEKKRIFSRFTGDETGFIHEEEPFFPFLAEGVSGRILPYGKNTAGAAVIEEDLGLNGSGIEFPEGTICFPLVGAFNRKNMYAAYEIGKILGVPFNDIKDALESVEPLFGRGQLLPGDVTVILDCYNANFDSMKEALNLMAGLPAEGRKIAVLGEMKELGDFSDEIHRKIGEYAASLPLDYVFFYGPGTAPAYEILSRIGTDSSGKLIKTSLYTNIEELSEAVTEVSKSGDLLLLKGSRSNELERVYRHLSFSRKEKTLC